MTVVRTNLEFRESELATMSERVDELESALKCDCFVRA
jgi:hypothetical protein